MIRTRAGYTGGASPSPTYRGMGDHTEAVQVDYDPSQISYAELLDLFWASHYPTLEPGAPQYKAAIWAHDENQLQAALASRDAVERRLGEPVTTEILPAGPFHRAEPEHQKWYLRRRAELAAPLQALYGDELTDSTAAARLNGGLAGPARLSSDRLLDQLGLAAPCVDAGAGAGG